MFESVRLTMKYFFDALDAEFAAGLFVNRLDSAGAVLKRADLLGKARQCGQELVEGGGRGREKPAITELA
jgi:hypothetical protein